MPITADRVIKIIDTAHECYKGINRLREVIRKIHDDMAKLAYRRDVPNDVMDILQITQISASIGYQFELPSEFVENLFEEKAKFALNEKKNRYARDRMRVLRHGTLDENGMQHDIKDSITRKRTWKERSIPERSDLNPLKPTIGPFALHLTQEDDKRFNLEQGMRLHPQDGPCIEPCPHCERLGVGYFAPGEKYDLLKKEQARKEREAAEASYATSPGTAPDGLEDEDPFRKVGGE